MGFADEPVVGLRRRDRHRVFVAAYTAPGEGTVTVRVGHRSILWDPDRLEIRRQRVAPFLKRFRILRGKAAEVSIWYWYHDDYDQWPGPEATDIFFFLARMARDRASVARFAYLWTAIARGRRTVTQGFIDELERHVRSVRADGRG
ncbi:MAG TPA: hypothetical protein VF006_12430 [Longimicrobium sp.]